MQTLLTFLLAACNNFFEFFSAYYIARTYIHKSYKPQARDFIPYILLLGSYLISNGQTGVALWCFAQIIYLVYFCSLIHETPLNRFMLFCLVHCSMLVLEGFAVVPLMLCIRLFAPSDIQITFIANFLVMTITLPLFSIPFVKGLYDKIRQGRTPVRFILLNSYMIFLFTLLFHKIHPENSYQTYVIFFCIALFLLALNLWLLYYDQRTRLQQQEIDSYQKNMPIYDSLIQEIRAGQHEYANHLQSLANLSVMYKDYDSLSRALQSYSLEFSNPMANYPLLQINMPLLAASLYSMASHAQEKGIALQFDIVNAVLESHAPEHELTDYITILTQNAIEACKAGDTVYTLLDSKEGSVQYEIRNPVPTMISPEEIGNFFKRGYSTKQTQADSDAASERASSDASSKQADDKRGLGLYYLQTNVTKSGGSVGADCVCYEDSYFIIFRLIL